MESYARHIDDIYFLFNMTEITPNSPQFSPKELNALFDAIEMYNKQFSAGSMIARMTSDSVRQSVGKSGDEEGGKALAKQRGERQVSEGSFVDGHANVLNIMGLQAEPVLGKDATIFTGGEQLDSGEMRLNIGNREKFLSFLQTIVAEDVQKNSTLTSNLGKLAEILERQIKDHYNTEEPSDEALNLLASMESLVKEFDRLGLKEQVNALRSHLERAQAGYLREYLLVQRQGIMVEEGQWGPSIWHKDMTAIRLKKSWDNTISTLKSIEKNPRASALAEELYEHLLNCVNSSIQDLSQTSDDFYKNSTIRKEDLSNVLEEARGSLAK